MKRAEKAIRIQNVLDELFPMPAIPLSHRDPFTLLCAVVLSAQTTDKKVNQVTPELFRRGGTPARLARLPQGEIHDLIREVGLAPAKSKALKGLSEIIATRHSGQVPRTFEELEALPGVGHKTASVVLAQAFGIPTFPVDTHIHRLAARWGLSNGRSVEQTERDLKRIFPEESWIKLHKQIIYFGREHCPARGHALETCPICAFAASKTRMRMEAAKNTPRSRAKVARKKA